MNTRTYYVSDIQQALDQIEKDLGPNASIVHTRKLPGSIWNRLQGRRLEVVASDDLSVPNRFSQWLEEDGAGSPKSQKDLIQEVARSTSKPIEVTAKKKDPKTTLSNSVHLETEESGSVDFLKTNTKEISPEWDPVHYWLEQLGGDTVAAKNLVSDLLKIHCEETGQVPEKAYCPPWDQLAKYLGRHLSFGVSISDVIQQGKSSGRPCWVAAIGPTGVGKTTTIAKLAGQFQRFHGLQVGLITVDTFRVGAIDQLQTYSKILGLPFRVVSSESEVEAAKRQMTGCDLVLVDTVGRSPRDKGRIDRLKGILSKMELDHLLLTLSSNSSCQSLENSLAAFSGFQSIAQNSLVISKIDEMESMTGLWPFLSKCPIPWSYWTNGQNVPEDIGEAKPNVALWFLDRIPLAENSAAV